METRKTGAMFFRSEEGNITAFSAIMLVLVLAITGAAVDIMRFEAVRAKMQSTMDRAVLAAADLDQRQDPVAVVNDYMAKAGLAGVVSDVQVEESATHRVVTASGTGELETIFLGMSGFDTLTAPALSVAEERISNVEISLVLDISGSMRFNDRIGKMRPAAQDFVDKVMTEESNGVTTLNLVPFAGHVNPGQILFDYYRGERPKIKKNQNNGWGNGDQDAPGNSLCNNNAENAEEGAADPSCSDGATSDASTGDASTGEDFFPTWPKQISNVVFYFDLDGDGVYDRAHKLRNFPSDAFKDADDFYKGSVAYLMWQDDSLTDPDMFLGLSIKGQGKKTSYYQVKGDQNGSEADIGPTKNRGKLPGDKVNYAQINFAAWEADYVAPVVPAPPVEDPESSDTEQNVNMPNSCIEIYDHEFANTNMPDSDDFVPHFMYWPIAQDVMDWGWCPGEDTAIQYYSDDAQALKDFIGDIRMHDGTGLHYAMKYALSLLDPDTSDAVNHLIDAGVVNEDFRGRPIAWHDEETEKFVVIMTDGQTTDQYRPVDPDNPLNGEVELQNQGGGSHERFTNRSDNIANLLAQCDLAKQLGVTVFTIAYETNQSASNDMRNCASSAGHFFHVQGAEISTAFDIVARQINNLRLIQ